MITIQEALNFYKRGLAVIYNPDKHVITVEKDKK
jgi:hypothetical protein